MRIVVSIICLVALSQLPGFKGEDNPNPNLCQETWTHDAIFYRTECTCSEAFGKTNSSWCYGTEKRPNNVPSILVCGLQERDEQKFKINACGVTINKCPYVGYFYSEELRRCFALQRIRRSQKDSQNACESQPGASLAKLTQESTKVIREYFRQRVWNPKFEEDTWIGLIYEDDDLQWVGQYPDYGWDNFVRGHPTKAHNCHKVAPGEDMKWKTEPCTTQLASLCESARLCTVSNCANGTDCVNISPTSQLCCVANQMDYCLDVNNCNPDPCKNGGECRSLTRAYRCSCKNGYAGNTCENANVNIQLGGATNLQPRGGITSVLSVCAILWVYYDQTAIIALFMM